MNYFARSVIVGVALMSLVGEEAFAQSGAAQRSANERIVGGEEAVLGDAPWAVRLNITRGGSKFICGASLVSPEPLPNGVVDWRSNVSGARWAITAAHCVDNTEGTAFVDPENIEAITGRIDLADSASGEVREVIAVMGHPDFDRANLSNDLALLVLNEATKDLAPVRRASIRLPNTQDTIWLGRPYLALMAQGWGRVGETMPTTAKLRQVRVPQVDYETCATAYGLHGYSIEPGMICAGFFSGGFDSCSGDSGGPLVLRPSNNVPLSLNLQHPVLVGAVSWGKGCARQDLYGIYTSLAFFRSWLDAKVEECLAENSFADCK
ncbi:S1 family peptidase [Roseobacter litoralis]|uniref:S1 family peptidase n=1 Tax=Roseobacter litoralis TaxID=42443 RepID=UPI002493E316|nr:serine protease [Roseobacter litoralis]